MGRLIRKVSEDAVIAALLRADLCSWRYGPRTRAGLAAEHRDPALLETPNLANPAENTSRRALANQLWDWERSFPIPLEWYRVALTTDELLTVRYMDDGGFWIEASGGSRLPLDLVERYRRGEALVGSRDPPEIAALVQQGQHFPELILVGRPDLSGLVLRDGHNRLTGFIYGREYLPAEVECYVGCSAEIAQWDGY